MKLVPSPKLNNFFWQKENVKKRRLATIPGNFHWGARFYEHDKDYRQGC